MALNFIVSRINPDCITIRCTYTYKDKDGAWRSVYVAPDNLRGTDNECFAISIADETIREMLQRTSQPYSAAGSVSDTADSKTTNHDFPDIDGLDIISRNEAAAALWKKVSVFGYLRTESALRIIKEIPSVTGAPCGSPGYDLISRKLVSSELWKDGCDYNSAIRDDVLDKLPPAKNAYPSRSDKKGKKCDSNVLPVVLGCVTVTGDSPNALIDVIQVLTAPGNDAPKDGDGGAQQKCKDGNKEGVSTQDAPTNSAALRQKIFDYIDSRLYKHSVKMQEENIDYEFHRASRCEALAIRAFIERLTSIEDIVDPSTGAPKNSGGDGMRALTADEIKMCRSYLERGVYDPYCKAFHLLCDMLDTTPHIYAVYGRKWAKMQKACCRKFLLEGVYDKNDVNYRALMAMLGDCPPDSVIWRNLGESKPLMPVEHECREREDNNGSPFLNHGEHASRSDDVFVIARSGDGETVSLIGHTYNGTWSYYPYSADAILWFRPIKWAPLPKYGKGGNE